MNFLNPGSMRGPKSCDTVAITFIYLIYYCNEPCFTALKWIKRV